MAKSPGVKTPSFALQERVVLAGSEKAAPLNAISIKATPASAQVTVSVIVKRKQPLRLTRRGGRSAEPARISRAEYKRRHVADPGALQQIKKFAAEFHLKVKEDATSALRRTVQLTGTAANTQRAFGVELHQKSINGKEYRVREGVVHLPKSLIGSVEAVLGLDNRPQAEPHFRVHKLSPRGMSAPSSYTPPQVAAAYQFPSQASGAGQTIGIIELGGGYRKTDLTAYFKSLGIPAPAIKAVSVQKGKNAPSTPSSSDTEVMLDIEVAAAVAPGAKIVVYFTPNTDQGFTDAITTAVHDAVNKPSVISISWGAAESAWTAQAMTALDAACQSAAALGVTITVAAGDNGSADGATGNNVDFPASSPHVLACGGTKLDANGATIISEVVWNELASNDGATGGGVSNFFPLPAWQANSKVPPPSGSTGGRGVPDVAGDADPNTGYQIRVDGTKSVVGGTSAVAPLWAGLIAVVNQQLKTTAGFIQPLIYTTKASAAFNDITIGNNGGFSAGVGWDACTGLGSPIGGKLLSLLAASAAGAAAKKRKSASSGKAGHPGGKAASRPGTNRTKTKLKKDSGKKPGKKTTKRK